MQFPEEQEVTRSVLVCIYHLKARPALIIRLENKDGQTSLLTGSEMQPHNSILTGSQINRIRMDCIGSSLNLYVNNTLVASAKDADFATGDVGILAGSFDQPGPDVYFDNFVVYKP